MAKCFATRHVLPTLPPLSFAAAYGSGAFPQLHASKNAKKPMLDFLLATDDSVEWHAQNMAANPSHYSRLARALGPRHVASLGEAAAGIYFNTHVTIAGRLVKYGVMSTAALLRDLTEWCSLYVAGRLHKPVAILQSVPEVNEALQGNLRGAAAVGASVCASRSTKIGATFSERDLYMAITALSYTGDPRMIVGENRNKVGNIVDAQHDLFADLYRGHFAGAGIIADNLQCMQWAPVDTPEEFRIESIGPPGAAHLVLPGGKLDTSDLAGTVRAASARQMLVGIVSAGPAKALQYTFEKLGKWVRGLLQTAKQKQL